MNETPTELSGTTVRSGFGPPEPTVVPTPRPPEHTVGFLQAIQSLVYVLIISLFLMTFTVQPIRIPSPSMEPTLLIGDFLLLDKQSAAGRAGGLLPPTGYRHGDIIVFHDPVEDPSVHLVKRIIGLPGDRIRMRDGIVYLNGKTQSEPYAVHRGRGRNTFRDDFPSLQNRDEGVDPAWWIRLRALTHDGEITVPPDHYFVMGDNRNNSEDSRYWGFVPKKAIVGEPILVYFSWRAAEEDDDDADALALLKPTPPGRFDFARWERTFHIVH